MSPTTPPAGDPSPTSAGTKATIVEAALETLKTRGFGGASAREIARAGNFNQALIFYHFGSVQNVLLASLDLVSERRMRAYRGGFEAATTLPQLAALAGEIYREDLENGYVTVLGEMVAGAASDPELGRAVVARIRPWLELVDDKARSLIAGSLFEGLIPTGDIAFAIVALYLGVDMLSHLDRDGTRAESLLELCVRLAPLAQALLPTRRQEAE